MSYIPLMIQGGLIGYLDGQAFPDYGWQFFAAIIANSVLTVVYGALKSIENNG